MMMYLSANKQSNERKKKPLHVDTIYEVIKILLLVVSNLIVITNGLSSQVNAGPFLINIFFQ
ncbi:hypothetical protein [Niallia circulans]|uniref:hypothetical protein n=1 Tax=Niallia circulans TaxID=1397 RepID=UPI001639955E|nr:hypothetical protein [Niallia circulans]